MSTTIDKEFYKLISNFKKFTETTITQLKEPIEKRNEFKGDGDDKRWKYTVLGPMVDMLKQNTRTMETLFQTVKELTLEREKEIEASFPKFEEKEPEIKSSRRNNKKSTKKQNTNIVKSPKEILEEIEEDFKEIPKHIDEVVNPLNIDFNQVMGRIEKVQFPESSNQQVFIGNLDSSGKKTGKGSLVDGLMLYNGNWEQDKRSGYGIQVYSDGVTFEGTWKDNKPQVGKWTFTDQSQFYGKYHKLTKEEKTEDEEAKEWMIGLKDLKEVELQLDEKRKFEVANTKTVLYYDGRATALKNIVLDQDIDIEGLRGEKEPHKITRIKYLNGVIYEGMWSDFRPNLFGKFIFPEGDEVKVLTRTGNTVPYLGCVPENIEEIMEIKFMEIAFLDGTTYRGSVNDNLEFYGFGELITQKYKVEDDKANGIFFKDYKESFSPQKGASMTNLDFQIDNTEEKVIFRGLFNSKEGLTVQFAEKDVSIIKNYPTEYFLDSMDYLKHHKGAVDPELHIYHPIQNEHGEITSHALTK